MLRYLNLPESIRLHSGSDRVRLTLIIFDADCVEFKPFGFLIVFGLSVHSFGLGSGCLDIKEESPDYFLKENTITQ